MPETEIPVTPAAASSAPVIDTTVSASALATESAPSSTPAVSTEAAVPLVETSAVESAKPESSLLAAESPIETKTEVKPEVKDEAKPEEKKPEVKADEKPAEPKTVEIEVPKFEAFKLPEGFTADEKVMGEFTGLLGKLEVSKGDHKATQEVGQQLVDLFTARLTEATKFQNESNIAFWEKTKQNRVDELKKDPYFGAGGDTTKQTQLQMEMAGFLQRNIPKAELQEFRKFAVENGIDNALPVARLINTLKQKIDKYENETGKMLPGTKPAPSKPVVGKGILTTLYGKQA
jgi:hypothetical protein